MKYWIFQNNQVLGPYGPDEMEKISVFSPESLVCPEGRRGTSMGDWQRAGMVPDLSVALVRASSSGGKTSTLSIAGLPPEPTLKDLAQLGSIQEKVAVLEEVVLQLQEGLRAKDAELSSVHQELAGKSREASEIRSEAVARVRESEELKRQIAGLEERLSAVRQLSETLDKAVEEEKRVESDVEKQGRTLTDLAKDVEELRRQLEESRSRQAELAAEAAAAAAAAATAAAAAAIPSPAPRAAEFVPPPPMPSPSPASRPPEPSMEFPKPEVPLPSFDPGMPAAPQDAAPSFDPMAFGDAASGALAPDPAAAPAAEPEAFGVDTSVPRPAPAPKGKKALLIGGVLGIAALGGLAVMGGYVPGLVKPQAPPEVLEPAPLPPPEPPPAAAVAPDPRELAVDLAKAWPLTGGRTLESALEELAPSAGNLSPWMADPLAGSRVQVNYFARSSAPGAPTIAYEFEVDLEAQTLIGRNAAAKSVLTGKAAPPPAPPKAKPVKVKPKAPVKKAPEEDSLDSLLGGDPAPDAAAGEEEPVEEAARPARPSPARRAAKAKPAVAAPADETLLDDLLKE